MKIDHESGSVTLDRREVKLVALVLDLGRELAEQTGAMEPETPERNVEVQLIKAINGLRLFGVSADELNDVVDSLLRHV